MMSPIIDEISGEVDDRVKVCKLNVDEATDMASEYGVMSIPTLIVFKNGEVFETLIGLQSKDAVLNVINKAL